MKNFFLLILATALLLGCGNDTVRNNNPYIPSYGFSYVINLNLNSALTAPINPVFLTEPGQKMHDRAQIQDFTRVPTQSSKIEKFGNKRLGDILVLADFLLIHGENILILTACGARESHGFQDGPCQREQQLRRGPGKSRVALHPAI